VSLPDLPRALLGREDIEALLQTTAADPDVMHAVGIVIHQHTNQ